MKRPISMGQTEVGKSRRFTSRPELWSDWWLALWAVTTPAWIILAFVLEWYWWLLAVAVLLLVPELLSVKVWRKNERPPLTWVIRYVFANEVSFPAMFGAWGAVTAHQLGQLGVARVIGAAVLAASLGWLTTHFTVAYDRPSQSPFDQPELDQPHARRRPVL